MGVTFPLLHARTGSCWSFKGCSHYGFDLTWLFVQDSKIKKESKPGYNCFGFCY